MHILPVSPCQGTPHHGEAEWQHQQSGGCASSEFPVSSYSIVSRTQYLLQSLYTFQVCWYPHCLCQDFLQQMYLNFPGGQHEECMPATGSLKEFSGSAFHIHTWQNEAIQVPVPRSTSGAGRHGSTHRRGAHRYIRSGSYCLVGWPGERTCISGQVQQTAACPVMG